MTEPWEPSYGFCAFNETDAVALAKTLEALRRSVCAYGGGDRCDCKYGLTVDPDRPLSIEDSGIRAMRYNFKEKKQTMQQRDSESTGCPELREMIHRLLHRDQPLF